MKGISQFGFGLLVAIGVLCAVAWFSGGMFRSSDVCVRCGAERDTNRVLWIPFSEVRATPLSRFLESHGRSADEGHSWVFVGGRGGPISCALGGGRRLMHAVKSKEIPEILEAIRVHRGDAAMTEWVERLLDPTKDRSLNAYLALYGLSDLGTDFDTGYTTAVEDYEAWMSDPKH